MNIEFWLGSEASFKLAQEGLAKAETQMQASDNFDPTEYGLLTNHDGVAVINIAGSLVTNAPAWASYFGVIGYNVLKDTLTIAAQDDTIDQILLNIDSGGGSASGVDAVASLIQKINADYKPITTFTEGTMCSAAYWIGASGQSISATRLSTVGSIGVIAISMEYTKMLEQDGVTATVFRSGEFKALGTPYEVMDEKAAAVIQEKLDLLYNEFTTNIAQVRGIPLSLEESQWGQGRTFLGFQGIDVGLVDNITTFEDLAANLKKGSASFKADRTKLDIGEDMARKALLDEKTVAILAAGGDVEAVLNEAPEATEAPAEAPATQEETAPVASEPAASAFEAQAAMNDRIIDLSVENKLLKQKVESMEANHSQLRIIAAEAINFKNVAMGRTRTDYSASTDEGLVSMYAQATESFNKTFPVGGVTEVASTERKTGEGQTMQQRRAVGATKI